MNIQKNRYLNAIDTVHRYLGYLPGWDTAVRFDDLESLVMSEKEAQRLIDFAEQNIPGATSMIELVNSGHGRLLFRRKIRFEDASIQPEEILEKLKESGYKASDGLWLHFFRC